MTQGFDEINAKMALHRRADNDFSYHRPAPDGEAVKTLELVRHNCRSLAHLLIDHCPTGRELSLALTSLEEVMMWANAGIARREPLG